MIFTQKHYIFCKIQLDARLYNHFSQVLVKRRSEHKSRTFQSGLTYTILGDMMKNLIIIPIAPSLCFQCTSITHVLLKSLIPHLYPLTFHIELEQL